jgi:3-hydroxyisobutyrate dehydrogenase-like beta-hydroxyacid dehydrogenase
MRLYLLSALAVLSSVALADESSNNAVTIIGLGGMGKAILQCYRKHGYFVHGWNRTPRHEEYLTDEGVTIHDTVEEAVAATDIIVVVINSEPHLKTLHDLLIPNDTSSARILLAGKTLINFVNHEPFAARDLELELETHRMDHVAGSLFAVPEAICSPGALILLSAPERSSAAMEKMIPSLSLLGSVESFSGDVGYGSIVSICLIQTLYFGLAGFELALLVLEKYGTPPATADRFLELESQVVRDQYYPYLSKVVASNIRNREWTKSYVPAQAALEMFEMHAACFARLGLVSDTFHSSYMKYLKLAVDDQADVGISAVVGQYTSEKFAFEEIETTDEL